jgi:hypothetical protein
VGCAHQPSLNSSVKGGQSPPYVNKLEPISFGIKEIDHEKILNSLYLSGRGHHDVDGFYTWLCRHRYSHS